MNVPVFIEIGFEEQSEELRSYFKNLVSVNQRFGSVLKKKYSFSVRTLVHTGQVSLRPEFYY